ncbi:uncharacterized protein [Henckelia pumila]|uniref:uncharacterized protein n=1 Tax=Henckelia pumila TaxID=405737 RepID=UPI003C6E7101
MARTKVTARKNVVRSKEQVIESLRTSLYVEQYEKEEMMEDMKKLKANKSEMEEHRDHLEADVERLAYYLDKEEKEHEETKKKLESSLATITLLEDLSNQRMMETLELQHQVQELQNSVQARDEFNAALLEHINHLQQVDMVAEENPEDVPAEDEASGDGEIID